MLTEFLFNHIGGKNLMSNIYDSHYSPEEIVEIIVMVRLNLYNRGVLYGAKAIQLELKRNNIQPLPSLSKISEVLKEKYLTHRRQGYKY